jgi:hypothetical protein
MMDRKNGMVFQQGIMICFIFSLVFLTGCLSNQPERNQSPTITPLNVPIVTTNEPDMSIQIQKDPTTSNPIQVTVHNVTVYSIMQKSGKEIKLVALDVSLKNLGVKESFSFDNISLISFQMNNEKVNFYPNTRNFQGDIRNPLLLRTLAPGEKTRGTVVFELVGDTESMVFYIKDPSWTILGEAFVPDIYNGAQSRSDREYTKNLGFIVHSAAQKNAIPGMGPFPEAKIAVVNVSIINNNPTDVTIKRENLLILTEREITLEHGGARVSDEIARDYLRFPCTIHSGETITGSVLYVVHSGTRINKIALTDNNLVINSMVDLNNIYQYE